MKKPNELFLLIKKFDKENTMTSTELISTLTSSLAWACAKNSYTLDKFNLMADYAKSVYEILLKQMFDKQDKDKKR